MGGADEPRRGRSGSAHQRHELLINKARSKLDFVRIQGSVAPKSVRSSLGGGGRPPAPQLDDVSVPRRL